MKWLTEPLIDGDISPNQPFSVSGIWKNWGEMSNQDKVSVVSRKISISEACHEDSELTFWWSIADKHNLQIQK